MTLTKRTPVRTSLLILPLVALVLAAILANLGFGLTPNARAASTDSVTVSAQVGSVLTVANSCGGTMGTLTVAMNGTVDGSCAITFGASNDATTTLRVSSSVGAFFSSTFTDEGGVCANLTTDEAGLKVAGITGGTGSTNAWGCATTAAGTYTGTPYKGVPDAYTNICASAAIGITNTCTLAVGVNETGGDATAGTPTATLLLDTIG